jgi:hypothetical protein
VTTTVTPQRESIRLWGAAIYGPSGALEDEDETETWKITHFRSSSSDRNSALVDFLSTTVLRPWLDLLAVAFAPPGHALDHEDEHVQVLRVDKNRDIQAVVCELKTVASLYKLRHLSASV